MLKLVEINDYVLWGKSAYANSESSLYGIPHTCRLISDQGLKSVTHSNVWSSWSCTGVRIHERFDGNETDLKPVSNWLFASATMSSLHVL